MPGRHAEVIQSLLSQKNHHNNKIQLYLRLVFCFFFKKKLFGASNYMGVFRSVTSSGVVINLNHVKMDFKISF